MEEILWMMAQRSRSLQDYRRDIRASWDDEAAKTLNTRYLNPHQTDDEEMLDSLQQQRENLTAANLEIHQAQQYALEAERLSREVQHFLEIKQQEADRAYHYYQKSQEFEAATQAQLPAIDNLINRANSAC
jgi:hypothetical protein